MKRAIVVGSGAGGATIARELQGSFDVVVLEAGGPFRPFPSILPLVAKARRSGLLFDERLIPLLFPSMRTRKCADGMVLVSGLGHGGTTTLSAGNAVRIDGALRAIGIDLDAEFRELASDIPVTTEHRASWHSSTNQAFVACQDLGLGPTPTPKMIDPALCIGCGRCVLGCPVGAKWDSRRFLDEAVGKGAQLVSGRRVKRVIVEDGRAKGVVATTGWRTTFHAADLVVLAAGGLGTPVVLQNSGIECQPRLFVDPVLCVAATIPESRQDAELPMPFIVQRERYIMSPYFDFLSFFFNRHWRHSSGGIFSLMIKLADTPTGSISSKGLDKGLTAEDTEALSEAVELCKGVFGRMGVPERSVFLGTLNAGHPGGMLPLTEDDNQSLHHARLPQNLYVADATLFPQSLGNPPILTIAALAKKVGKACRKLE